MNRVYRLVWNRSLQLWQVTSERAARRRAGRSAGGSTGGTNGGKNGEANDGQAKWRRHGLAVALAAVAPWAGSAAYAAGSCTPFAIADGDAVTCSGPAVPSDESLSSSANNLTVNVLSDGELGVPINTAGPALSLTGNNIRVTNAGNIDAYLTGTTSFIASGIFLGNSTANVINLDNAVGGVIRGTAFGPATSLPNLQGLALAVQNSNVGASGASGRTVITNEGDISSQAVGGDITLKPSDMPVVASYGGGQTNFVNTGTVTGRVAFAQSRVGTGNWFANGGIVNGSVYLGDGGTNTFTVVSGSTVSAGGGSAAAMTVATVPGLVFAPTGVVDGGAGANDVLELQNAQPLGGGTGTGSGGAVTNISHDTYINFDHLIVHSGTWNLSGVLVNFLAELDGGTVNIQQGDVFGSATVIADGGTIVPSASGMVMANNVQLNSGGLTIGGANGLTLSGALSGSGGLSMDIPGTVTLSGASSYTGDTVITAGTLEVRDDGTLSSASAVNLVNPGATLDISSANANQEIGALSGGAGTYVGLGARTLTMDAGTNTTFFGTIGGTGGLVKEGSGVFSLAGTNIYTGATIVKAGTLAVVGGGSLAASSPVEVDTGGTLDVSGRAGNSTIADLSGNGGVVQIGARTLTVDNGNDTAFAGAIQGSTGGLVKAGSRTLTLNGTNTYGGATLVNAGTLIIGDAAHTSASVQSGITVASGAALGGFGQVTGDVDVLTGGKLAPGGSTGTFTVNGNLSLEQGSQLAYSFGAPGADSNTLAPGHSVQVNGDLTINGSTITPIDAGGFGPGLYNLFNYTGTLTRNNGGLVPSSGSYVVQNLTSTRQINLINFTGTDVNVWNGNGLAGPSQMGGGNGLWSQDIPNWADANGTVITTRTAADAYAIFGGAAGTVTVDTAGGTKPVSTQGLQFASDGYQLNGDNITLVEPSAGALSEIKVGDGSAGSANWTATIENAITGNGINKTGLGTLVLDGESSYGPTTRISEGVLSVAENQYLGALTSGIDLEGGTLRITGTSFNSTARTITLGAAGGGIDIADAGNTFTLSQGLSGTGSFTKAGSGTLVMTANNTYTGGTRITAGTLQLGNGGGAGAIAGDVDIASGATLAFKRTGDVTFSGVISGNGNLHQMGSLPYLVILTGQNTFTGVTTIDHNAVLQLGNGGTGGGLGGDIVNNGFLQFYRADDNSYGGSISGNGSLSKRGSNTLTLTGDSSAYTGSTTIAAGTLQVDGRLGGSVSAFGGTLGGTGTVGTTTIDQHGTLSPGSAASPIGTLTVNGDLTFTPLGTYRIDTAPNGASDSVHVTGSASPAGSVVTLAGNGNYAPLTKYRILSADNGVHGSFGSVSSDMAFLTPALSYESNAVYLSVQRKVVDDSKGGTNTDIGKHPIRFADLAASSNQRAVADALDSLPSNNSLYLRVLNLPNGQPQAVFESLMAQQQAAMVSSLMSVASGVVSMSMERLQANLDAGQVAGPPTAQLGLGDASALPRSAAQPVWAQVFGNWRTMSGQGDTSKVDQTDGGLFIGGDHGVGKGWRVGGALGYTGTHSSVDGQSSTASVDSYTASIYGGKAFAAGVGKINFTAGAAYTWHDIKTERNANAAGQFQDLDASYSASTGQFFTELGYALPLNDRVTVEPFLGADYSDLHTRGFSESGGDAALSAQSSRNQIASTTLGLHASTAFDSSGAQGRLRGSVGWRHSYGDVNPRTTMAFDGSQPFTIAGTPIARDSAVLALGVDMAVTKHTTVGLTYGGQFGGGNKQNTGSIEARWSF